MFHEPRTPAYISGLRRFIEDRYALDILRFSEADRGYYGETWDIKAKTGRFFLKIVYFPAHKSRYERSFPVVQYMNDCGIDFISRIVPAKDGLLHSAFQGGVLGLFHFVEGVHTEDYPLRELFRLLARIYRLPGPVPAIGAETFDCRYAQQFYGLFKELRHSGHPAAQKAVAILERNRETLSRCRQQLEKYAAANEGRRDHFVITSGDVGGNVIVQDQKLTIIDWDYLLLAPPERDLWPYMQDKAQIRLVDEVFQESGVGYTVRRERLTYYCYASFFYYLHAYISGIGLFTRQETLTAIINDLNAFFQPDNWVFRCMAKIGQY